MDHVTILLPKYDNNGDRLYCEGQDILSEIKKKCGGMTLSNAAGVWVNDAGEEFTDYHLRVEVDCDDASWICGRAGEWCTFLRQESLYVRVETAEVHFIGPA